jgi:ornithine cyclodeaminase/alanine dehydrogenase-like protein (mu-crystallin family)
VTMPVRSIIPAAGGAGTVMLMPCLSDGNARIGLKFLTIYEKNRAAGLPLIQALVILADAETGTPLAILDGESLTALRTGAVVGAATDALARPDAVVAAVFGAGVQARTHLEAVASVRRLRLARVFDMDPASAATYAREMTARLGFEVLAATDPAAALRGADIVGTVTTSRRPVFEDRDVAVGTHINAVGISQLDRAEIPPATVKRARVVIDQMAAALEEAGDLVQPLDDALFPPAHIATELGDVLLGRAPGRLTPEEITLFKSVGLAVQDLYAAARVYDKAVRLGLGLELPR